MNYTYLRAKVKLNRNNLAQLLYLCLQTGVTIMSDRFFLSNYTQKQLANGKIECVFKIPLDNIELFKEKSGLDFLPPLEIKQN